MPALICNLQTDGRGYWSTEARTVSVQEWDLGYINETASFGELRVFFDRASWDTFEHGLIYTDDTFESQLRDALKIVGFSDAAVADIDYSEQGMQGMNYVSFDAGPVFLRAVADLHPDYWQDITGTWGVLPEIWHDLLR